MVNGGACQGKTETVCEALACFEDEWLGLYDMVAGSVEGTLDHHVPVVYVRTPVKATPISACQRILDFYGEDHKGMTPGGPCCAPSSRPSTTTGPRSWQSTTSRG